MGGLPKKWKDGMADEAWKVMICARDANRAEDIASHLAYILTDLGHASFEQQIEAISAFSGEQIATALKERVLSGQRAIAAALQPGEKTPKS